MFSASKQRFGVWHSVGTLYYQQCNLQLLVNRNEIMESKSNRNQSKMRNIYFCSANQVTASETMRTSASASIIADAHIAHLSGPGSLVTVNQPLNNNLIYTLKLKSSSLKIAGVAALAAISAFVAPTSGRTQTFSRAVVVMSGVVHSDETAKPTSVKVSIREVGDTAREITCSTSNKETGKYLVVLQPGKKYWVHLEGDSILTKDELVETPTVQQTQQMKHDFSVIMREAEDVTKPLQTAQQN